jgi:hypothetical protein
MILPSGVNVTIPRPDVFQDFGTQRGMESKVEEGSTDILPTTRPAPDGTYSSALKTGRHD